MSEDLKATISADSSQLNQALDDAQKNAEKSAQSIDKVSNSAKNLETSATTAASSVRTMATANNEAASASQAISKNITEIGSAMATAGSAVGGECAKIADGLQQSAQSIDKVSDSAKNLETSACNAASSVRTLAIANKEAAASAQATSKNITAIGSAMATAGSAVGGQCGKIASSLQKVIQIAMTAKTAAAGGIVGIAIGLGVIGKQIYDWCKEAAEEIKKAIEELKSAALSANSASISSEGERNNSKKNLMDRTFELANKDNKSAADIQELTELVQNLGRSYEEYGIIVNKVTGDVTGLEEAMIRAAKKENDLAREKINAEMKEADKAKNDAEKALKKREKELQKKKNYTGSYDDDEQYAAAKQNYQAQVRRSDALYRQSVDINYKENIDIASIRAKFGRASEARTAKAEEEKKKQQEEAEKKKQQEEAEKKKLSEEAAKKQAEEQKALQSQLDESIRNLVREYGKQTETIKKNKEESKAASEAAKQASEDYKKSVADSASARRAEIEEEKRQREMERREKQIQSFGFDISDYFNETGANRIKRIQNAKLDARIAEKMEKINEGKSVTFLGHEQKRINELRRLQRAQEWDEGYDERQAKKERRRERKAVVLSSRESMNEANNAVIQAEATYKSSVDRGTEMKQEISKIASEMGTTFDKLTSSLRPIDYRDQLTQIARLLQSLPKAK